MPSSSTPDASMPGAAAARPHRARRWWILGAIAVIVVIAGLWWADRSAADEAAAADAARLAPAAVSAQDAYAELTDVVTVAQTYLDETAAPLRTVADTHTSVVGKKSVAKLKKAVAGLSDAIEAADLGDAPAPEGLSADSAGYQDELTERYRQVRGADRDAQRKKIADQVVRLNEAADAASDAAADVHDAVDAADSAVVAVATATAKAGKKLSKGLEYADDSAKKKVDATVKTLNAIAKTDLPIAWEEHEKAADDPLAGMSKAVDTYVKARKAAQKSEKENTPPPPSSDGAGGSGGSGGGAQSPSLCYRYSPWPPYSELVWC